MLQTLKQAVRMVPGAQNAMRLVRFARFRANCWREDLADPRGNPAWPPALLRYRVGGETSLLKFQTVGERNACHIKDVLTRHRRPIPTFQNTLDLGCGCGRVLRHFEGHAGGARFTGTDIDGDAIRWCQRHLTFATFVVNASNPPLPFTEGTFDLIYAISLFTHLDEDMQFAWLDEIARVLQIGGIALLTIHGEWAQRKRDDRPSAVSDAERDACKANGFLFKVVESGRYKFNGMPDYYQAAFHSEAYVRERWNRRGLCVVDVHRAAINEHQDAVVLMRSH